MDNITRSNQSYMITTAYAGEGSIYHEIIKKRKLFPAMYNFFALGLVYGILHNKKSVIPRSRNSSAKTDGVGFSSNFQSSLNCFMASLPYFFHILPS